METILNTQQEPLKQEIPSEVTAQQPSTKVDIQEKKKRTYSKKENLKRFFYPKEWIKCMNKLNNEKHKFWLELLLHTGARINEARGIQVRDVDFIRESITLRKTKGGQKKNRTIQISSYLKGRIEIYVKNNNLGAYDYLMQNNQQNKKVPSTPAIDKIIKKFARDGELLDWKDFSAHNLRKTLENYLVKRNHNILSIQAHMGHTLDVASSHYVATSLLNQEDDSLIKAILDNLLEK